MDIHIIQHEMPPSGLWTSSHDPLQMGQKILLRAGRSRPRRHQLASHDIPTENKGAGSVSNLFELTPLPFAHSPRQARVLAFQGLHARQFIGAQHLFSLLGEGGRFLVQGAKVSHLLF